MTHIRCNAHLCGAVYEVTTDGSGHLVGDCHQCARKKAGICRDCPKRTPSKRHIRCLACGRKHDRSLERVRDRERYAQQRPTMLARAAAYRAKPDIAQQRAAYMADYRARHPRDEFDRAYSRVHQQMLRADPGYREREAARKRERRARERAERQQRAQAQAA